MVKQPKIASNTINDRCYINKYDSVSRGHCEYGDEVNPFDVFQTTKHLLGLNEYGPKILKVKDKFK